MEALKTQNLRAGGTPLSANLQNLAPHTPRASQQNNNSSARHSPHRPARTREFAQPLAALAALSALIILGVTALRASAQPIARAGSASSAPLLFEPCNVPGSPIRYLARAAHFTAFLSNDEADVVLQQEKAPSQQLQRGGLIIVQAHASLLRIRFVDADPPTSLNPADRQISAASPLTAVAYRGLYPGTDIILRGDQQRLQFQVNLGPGASAENATIEFAGATGLNLRPDGTAVVRAGGAALLLERPLILRHRLLYGSQPPQSSLGAFQIEKGNRLRFVITSRAPAQHHQNA